MPSVLLAEDLDVIVIGAGFGGCYLLRNLRKQGFRVNVIEEAQGIGGVWWHNRYPGARVDTSTPCYEFSDPELWNEWHWSETYPGQEEILRYFEFVDKKWDLSKDISFGTKVAKAIFDSDDNKWSVYSEDGSLWRARWLLPAMGFAAKEYIPSLKGLENFQGFTCHTAKWPKDPVDLRGKRVAVIGTGATGVQIIQELGPKVDHMVVFQRSPNCAMPMRQRITTPDAVNKLEYPEMFKNMKLSATGSNFKSVPRGGMDDSPEQRQELFEALWELGGWAPTQANYGDLMTDIALNNTFYGFWRDKVRQRLTKNDPELIENLAPRDPPFPFGTKRPSLEQSFYEVFNQDNVELVALKSNPIDEVEAHGIRTADGRFHEVDALILATGFDAVTGSFSRVDLQGVDGMRLSEKWSKGSRTSMGIATAGFPNMLFLYGPQSPITMATGPVLSEIQSEFIIQTLCHMRQHGKTKIDATGEAENYWARVTYDECYKTLLPLNQTSWYMGGNVPGKARAPLNYMGGLASYHQALLECLQNGWSSFSMD